VYFDFRLVYNSTHSSLQAHVTLRCYNANMVYLQHGGVYYCTLNDVAITSCIILYTGRQRDYNSCTAYDCVLFSKRVMVCV